MHREVGFLPLSLLSRMEGAVLAKFSEIMAAVYTEKAPHKLCQFIYEVSNAFNGFYHDTKILAETDEAKQKGYIALICLTKAVLEQCIELLAIECPDRM